jgi:phosphoglycerol transferase MdoB-like AlkP superfamily enzyme
MLSGDSPATWHGWLHAIAFLLIIAMGVVAPLAMALAVRGDHSWRPIAVVSLAATALLVVFLFLPGQRLIPGGDRHCLRLDRGGCRTPGDASLLNHPVLEWPMNVAL